MKKWLVLLFILVLVGCTEKLPDFEEYTGRPLDIAVIGAAPDVRETNVVFEEFTINDLLFIDFSEYDAVFIMKEQLVEASAAEYAEVYTSSRIPFFFIESTKGSRPFIYADETYDNTQQYGDAMALKFAAGYVPSKDSEIEPTTYSFGLYNDIKNEETVEGVYSHLFMMTEKHVK